MTKTSLFYLKLNSLCCLAIGGCNYHVDKAPLDLTPTYANVRGNVIVPYCLRCHSEFDSSFQVEKQRVDICDALSQGIMPPSGARPSKALVKMVCDWAEGIR